MRYLWRSGKELLEKWRTSVILLFLDYDGTLIPIAGHPDLATLPPATRGVLSKISDTEDLRLVIVSGRSAEDIKKKIAIPGLIYVGNHGYEIQGPQVRFPKFHLPEYPRRLLPIKKELRSKIVEQIAGAFLEDKGTTLSLHFRGVKKIHRPTLKRLFEKILKPYRLEGSVNISAGKKVFEVAPSWVWNKGKAVIWLLKHFKANVKKRPLVAVYVGDDTTDEDAFRSLRHKGYTIRIGQRRSSQAQYYLKDSREVVKFLKEILKLKQGNSPCL